MSGNHARVSFLESFRAAGPCSEDVFFSEGESGDEEPVFDCCLVTPVPRPRGSQGLHREARPGKASDKSGTDASPEQQNLSDSATPPKECQEDTNDLSHKSWRLGATVVPVQPSGFSDEDSEGEHDLFSDSFREQVFRGQQATARSPAAAYHGTAAKSVPCTNAGGDESKHGLNGKAPSEKEGGLAEISFVRLSARISQRLADKNARLPPASAPVPTGMQKQHSYPPAAAAAGPKSSVYEDMFREIDAEAERRSETDSVPAVSPLQLLESTIPDGQTMGRGEDSFDYELAAPGGQGDMDSALDHGSQFHCYGDVEIEEVQSDITMHEEGRTESSMPDSEMQSTACLNDPGASHITADRCTQDNLANDLCQQKHNSDAKEQNSKRAPVDTDVPSKLLAGCKTKKVAFSGSQVSARVGGIFGSILDEMQALQSAGHFHQGVVGGSEIHFMTGRGSLVVPSQEVLSKTAKKYGEKSISSMSGGTASRCANNNVAAAPETRAACEGSTCGEGKMLATKEMGNKTFQGVTTLSQSDDQSQREDSSMQDFLSLQPGNAGVSHAMLPLASRYSTDHVSKADQGWTPHPPSVSLQRTSTACGGKHTPEIAAALPTWNRSGGADIPTSGEILQRTQMTVGVAVSDNRVECDGIQKQFSYHLPEEHAARDNGAGIGHVFFTTGKGKSLAPTSESMKKATSIMGGLLGDLSALNDPNSHESIHSRSFGQGMGSGGKLTAGLPEEMMDPSPAIGVQNLKPSQDETQAQSAQVPIEGTVATRSHVPRKGCATQDGASRMTFDYELATPHASADAVPLLGFKSGTGRSLSIRSNSMKSAASIFGSLLGDMQGLLADRSPVDGADEHEKGPTFSTGLGKTVQPSQQSMRRVASKYSDKQSPKKIAHLCGRAGPIFSMGTGGTINCSQESLKSSHGGSSTVNALENVEQSHCWGQNVVCGQEHSGGERLPDNLLAHAAESEAVFSTGTGRVMQPSKEALLKAKAGFGNKFDMSTPGPTSKDRSEVLPPTTGTSRSIAERKSGPPSSGSRRFESHSRDDSLDAQARLRESPAARRPAVPLNDRRPFKVPRRLAAPSLSTSTANTSVEQSIADSPSVCQTPRTPGLLLSNNGMLLSSTGKTLATPRHLFSPETTMKITGFRVTNCAIMDASMSVLSTNLSLNGSMNVGTSEMAVDETLNHARRLSVPLKEAVENAIPFEDWTNGNIEIQEYMKIRQISQHNAVLYRFTNSCSHFFDAANTGDGDRGIGLDEMYAALQERCQDAAETCPDRMWAENHYKLIVWKFAAMERAFPSIFGGRWLTPDRVMLQLIERYEKEVLGGVRSVLLQIKQRDQMGSQHLVLCVSGIQADSEPVKLDLMDGWHSVQALASPCLANLVRQNKIFVGQKLRVYGAETTQQEGKEAVLKIGCNGVRRAEWHAKLGATTAPPPFISVRSIKPGEGVVPAILVVVQRVFPLVHMEAMASGEKVWRSSGCEEEAQAAALKARQDAWDKLLAANVKMEKMEGDADSPEEAQERQDKVQEWQQDFLRDQVERKVFATMRMKVACLSPARTQFGSGLPPAEAYITFWRPQECIRENAQEGAILELYNLAVSPMLKNQLSCLSSMNGTKCHRLRKVEACVQGQVQSAFRARTWTDVSQLHTAGVDQELDLIGIVVAVSDTYSLMTHKGPVRKQSIVLSAARTLDEEECYIVVRLDLAGLTPLNLPADRSGKRKGPAVLALKNLRNLDRARLPGEEASCNVFTCSAFEDAEVLYAAPADSDRGRACGSMSSGSLSESWLQLEEWLKCAQSSGEQPSVLTEACMRARRILDWAGARCGVDQ